MTVTENTIEIEGRKYLCQKRVVTGSVEVDGVDTPAGLIVEYSFDRETWNSGMFAAYSAAEKSNKLMVVGEDVTSGGEYEAFMVGLLGEIGTLRVGDSLKISRDQTNLMVTREQSVLGIRASIVREMNVNMEQDNGPPNSG